MDVEGVRLGPAAGGIALDAEPGGPVDPVEPLMLHAQCSRRPHLL